jgi:hypothetical protein
MNDSADNERLLEDVLSEAVPADFREALLGETLRLARRRRRFRQTRRAVSAVAVLAALAALVWQSLPPRGVVPQKAGKSYVVVRTRPLPVSALVTTRPLAAGQLVASVETVGVVETVAGSGGFRVIGDDELLALVSPRPAALVRLGPHSEQLFFVNPEDEKGFLVD